MGNNIPNGNTTNVYDCKIVGIETNELNHIVL